MYNIAINLVWFKRHIFSSDYVYFKNLMFGLNKLKKVDKNIRVSVYINKNYQNDIENYRNTYLTNLRLSIVFCTNKIFLNRNLFKTFDMVFTPNWYFPPFFSNNKTKFLTLVHDYGWKKHNKLSLRYIYGFIIFPLLKKALGHKIVFTTKDVSLSYDLGEKIIGVPILADHQLSKMEIPFKKYFLVISTNLPHKNIQVLIQAIQKEKKINLILIGNHNNFENENIIVLKSVTESEKWYLIDNCIALINPSVFEGFGMPVAEAIIMKKHAVVSDLNVYKEYVLAGLVRVNDNKNYQEWLQKLKELWYNNNKFIKEKYGKPCLKKDFVLPERVASKIIRFGKEN